MLKGRACSVCLRACSVWLMPCFSSHSCVCDVCELGLVCDYSMIGFVLCVCCQRSMAVFKNKPLYDTLRSNAVESVMDLSIVGLAWYVLTRRLHSNVDAVAFVSSRTFLCVV
jgi:hypothetical protein